LCPFKKTAYNNVTVYGKYLHFSVKIKDMELIYILIIYQLRILDTTFHFVGFELLYKYRYFFFAGIEIP